MTDVTGRALDGAASVLVVGRRDEIRDLIVEILESLSYDVAVADNGQQALAAAQRQPPRSILLDSLDPAETRAFLRARREDPTLATIPVGALAANRRLSEWWNEGVHVVVRKPFRTLELVRAIRELTGIDGSLGSSRRTEGIR